MIFFGLMDMVSKVDETLPSPKARSMGLIPTLEIKLLDRGIAARISLS